MAYSSTTLRRLVGIGGLACLCFLLSGCPSASNPTQSQTPPSPSASAPPPGGASAPPGSSSSSSSQPAGGSSAGGDQSSASQPGGTDGDSGGASGVPQAELPQGSGDQASASAGGEGDQAGGSGSADPGFGDAAGGADGLPDMRDEPSLEDPPVTTGVTMGDIVGAPGEANTGESGSGGSGMPGGQQAGGGSTPGRSGRYGDIVGTPSRGGSGPLTPAEQVAILDAQLEKGAGDFDTMILETEAEQRRSAREQAAERPAQSPGSGKSRESGEAAGTHGDSPYDGGMAGTGGHSSGGGMGGATAGGGMPQNTAKYPPPSDVPSGDDDDVVARQLREAAMREPDPAVREKLWDEYRKYKGI